MEILESTTDAMGRKIEVIKVPCPPPMFRTHKEADSVDVSAAPARARRCNMGAWGPRGLTRGLPSLAALAPPPLWPRNPCLT